MKELCFDISTWQGGINYDEIKKRVNYCILRAGFWDTKDNQFENHYNNLKDLNLGAYWYSYATTEDEARMEANTMLNVIRGKNFTMPIFMDVEDNCMANLGKDKLNSIIKAFGEVIEKAGYYFAVYTNLNWYRNIISGSELNKTYDWWIACWSDTAPSGVDYGVWQFTSQYNDFGTRLDANYVVKDYPSIIKTAKLNHLSDDIEPTPEPQPEPIDDKNKQIEELQEEIEELNNTIALKDKQIEELTNAIVNSKYEKIIEESNYYKIKMYKGESLIIKFKEDTDYEMYLNKDSEIKIK